MLNSILSSERSFKKESNLIQFRSIESLCKQCQDAIETRAYDSSKLDELKKLFKEAFELYISNGGYSDYELINVEVNSNFNRIRMRITVQSRQVGTVKEFLFPGIQDKSSKKIIVQALVTLG